MAGSCQELADAQRVITWLCQLEDPVALNVNVPNVVLAELGGLRRAGLASGGTVQTAVSEIGSGHHRVIAETGVPAFEADSDVMLVAAGVASFSPLCPVCEDVDFDTGTL